MVKPTKPVVYVSSTFIDLKEHRQMLKQALEQSGYNVEAMERYPAFDERPLERCLDDVADCDFYVLLLAHRYGFRPEVDGKKTLSITEREYLHAGACRKPRLGPAHQPRSRHACLGELTQIDGCDHAWFEDRAAPCTLLVFVDDATSRLMQLHFVPTKSTFAYFEALHQYLRRHGKPVAFYSDMAGIFRPTNETAESGRGVTQFGRALYELNIEGWCANSSQAKGRVERAHLTLQDRLVKELRLRGICSHEAANAFVPHFMANYISRFATPRAAPLMRTGRCAATKTSTPSLPGARSERTPSHSRCSTTASSTCCPTSQIPAICPCATSTSGSTPTAASNCVPRARWFPSCATTGCRPSTLASWWSTNA